MTTAKVHPNHWLPLWWSRVAGFQIAGITLGRSIYLRCEAPTEPADRLLAHEQVHVEQVAELGMPRAALLYVCDFLRAWWALRDRHGAYLAVRMEQEARSLEATACPWREVGLHREPRGWEAFDLPVRAQPGLVQRSLSALLPRHATHLPIPEIEEHDRAPEISAESEHAGMIVRLAQERRLAAAWVEAKHAARLDAAALWPNGERYRDPETGGWILPPGDSEPDALQAVVIQGLARREKNRGAVARLKRLGGTKRRKP